MDFIDPLIILIGALDILLSFVVFTRNKKNRVNVSLAVFSLFLGAWAFGIAFFRMTDHSLMTFLWAKDIYIAGSSIAVALLYFALVFPEGKPLKKKTKFLIFLPGLFHALVLFIPSYLTKDIVYHSWGKEVTLGGIEYFIFSVYFLVFFYGALYILWKKYKKYSGLKKKQILFIFISILVAGFVSSIFDLLLPWLHNYELIFVGPISSGMIFWFIVYAIVRHKLLDIRLVIARSVVYSLLVTLLAAFYTAAVFLLSHFFFQGEISGNQVFVYGMLAVFVAFTFQPLKILLQRETDKVFFKGKYSSNDLLSVLTKTMAEKFHLEDIAQYTLQELLETLRASKGSFFLFAKDSMRTFFYPNNINQYELNKETITMLASYKRMLVFDEEDESIKQKLRKLEIAIALPLYFEGELLGMLILGDKKSGEMFSQQDIEVLEIFGSQVAIAINNALSYEEIQKFNVTLKKEIADATQNLQRANERLKQLDKLKDEFVSLASHELRTPVTVIKSYLWLLLQERKGKLNDTQRLYLERTFSSADRLINLVNDLLNVSRIESGRLSIEKQQINIKELIELTVTEMSQEAKKQGLRLVFSSEENKDIVVPLDPERIKQVLINLVGNAIKFTPKGGKITVSLAADKKDNTVKVAIQDTGIGIAKESMTKLFQKFGLLRKSYEKQEVQGTGLGLYISKNIIKLHHGKIWAESEGEGKGAVFTFTLPLE